MSEKVEGTNVNKNKLFSDAIHYTLDLLHRKNYLVQGTQNISRQAAILGQEIFEYLEKSKNDLSNEKININLCPENISRKRASVDEPEEILVPTPKKKACVVPSTAERKSTRDEIKKINEQKNNNKKNSNDAFEKKEDEKLGKTDEENVETVDEEEEEDLKIEEKKNQTEFKTTKPRNMYRIPLELKKKIVQFAKKNPRVTLAELERRFGCSLSTKQQLRRWEREVNQGGTVLDRRALVYSWVYEKLCESRKKNIEATTRMLQAWAIEANNKYFAPKKNPLFAFSASIGWTQRFKRWCKTVDSSSDFKRQDSSSSNSDDETTDKLPENKQKITAVVTLVLSLSPRGSD